MKLPTAAEEQHDPTDADERYRSATRQLIERRRDDKYKLVHKENAAYGFRRNLCGLKPFAVTIIAVCVAWAIGAIAASMPGALSWQNAVSDFAVRPTLYVLAVANVVAALFWICVVHRDFVHQAAVEYAWALLRTLDDAPVRSRKPAKPKT